MALAAATQSDQALRLDALGELPPLPQNAQRLLQEISADDVDIPKLCSLIETDPAISARVVGLANSAYFARAMPVRSVRDAVVGVLGLSLVKNLVFSVSVSAAFNPEECPRFDAQRYWRDALMTATFARAFAKLTQGDDAVEPDAAYLCGLLYSIGVVLLTHSQPAAMDEVFRVVEVTDAELLSVEHRELGLDHVEAGAYIAERWRLPDEVAVTIAHHREWSYRGPHWNISSLVGFSKWVVGDVLSDSDSFLAAPIPDGLGLDEEAVSLTTIDCAGHVEEVLELAKIFSR